MNNTIEELKLLRESEDHVEFKEAKHDFNYNGGDHADPKRRRHCVLGYVVALANEGGGRLVFGMTDQRPHSVVGTDFALDQLGKLHDAIYKSLSIRVKLDELFDDDGKRVIVFNVPSRPIGDMLKFEGVPLMRTGESLREMSNDEIFKILSEKEPDFSANICEGLTLADLDSDAIRIMKSRYAEKNDNAAFATASDEQALSDLELLKDNKLNYAALILLGKQEVIKRFLPQYNVVIEYRHDPASIQYDDRQEFCKPLFLSIDEIWSYLNQPSSNPMIHINEGAYIIDIKSFNRDAVREAVLNALSHRSLIIQSDVVIKQSPNELSITNAGGFPIGVSLSNILTVNSTPRSKRLTDVLQKTGLVERSGQGVDKMFTQSIMEAKFLPDYSSTDAYQVGLTFRTEIRDVSFLIYIRTIQEQRDVNHKLNVLELLTLYKVHFGLEEGEDLNRKVVEKLLSEGLLVRNNKGELKLSNAYKDIEREVHNVKSIDWLGILDNCFSRSRYVTRKQYSSFLPNSLSIDQVRYALSKFEELGLIRREGSGRGTKYVKIRDFNEL